MSDHIQIGDVTPRVQYVADGTMTDYTFPFPIFQIADLEVYLDGVQQLSGYTVQGAGQTAGGTITFDIAPNAATSIVLRRFMSIQRTTDFQEGGTFLAKTINDELDRQTAFSQQLATGLGRVVRLTAFDGESNLILPIAETRANKVMAFSGSGDVEISTMTLADIEAGANMAAASASEAEVAKNDSQAAQVAAEIAQVGAEAAENNASASAHSAAAIANAQMFRVVSFKSWVDSPITVSEADNGTLFIIDTTGGDVMVGVPGAASLSALPYNIAVLKTTSDANRVIVDPGSTDTIDGQPTWVLSEDQEAVAIVADISGEPDDWQVVRFGIPLQDGTVTKEKLADGAKPYDVALYAGYDGEFSAEPLNAQTYAKFMVPRAVTLEAVSGVVEDAPTGGGLVFDILVNGSSVFSTRPEISAGHTSLSVPGVFTSTAVSAGDVITFDVAEVGSGNPGSGCTFALKGRVF